MTAALFVAGLALVLQVTRTTRAGFLFPRGSALLLLDMVILFSYPNLTGLALCVVVTVATAWFAWSEKVPFVFKDWSYYRMVGAKQYRREDVPATVWERPRWVDRHWPSFL